MKNHDIIRTFEKSLFVLFGSTGELQQASTLSLDRGITFARNGTAIEAHYHAGAQETFVVEQFASEPLADAAFHGLKEALSRYARVRRLSGRWKSAIRWVLAPVVLTVFALAVNMAATRMGGEPGTGGVAQNGVAPLMAPPTTIGAGVTPPQAVAQAPASAAQLSRAMADGAKSGKYAVQLSRGAKGTLYVFSDPSCPHCQDLEPELVKLAADYTIYIFPVTVIGGEASSHRAAKLMCAKPDARAALWKKIVMGDDLTGSECSEGSDAIARNDQMFRVMRFLGTPTIINGAGEQTPDSIPNTASAISLWMSSTSAASK